MSNKYIKDGIHKKRKHEKCMVSSSSREEDIPKMSSNKEKIKEKPSPESKLKLRIKSYLNENNDKSYIDYNDMAKSLHDKFPEYTLFKFKVFKVAVEESFESILETFNKESESPKKETPKGQLILE